jgi:hypothetical protein
MELDSIKERMTGKRKLPGYENAGSLSCECEIEIFMKLAIDLSRAKFIPVYQICTALRRSF